MTIRTIFQNRPLREVEVEFKTEDDREKWNEDVSKPAEHFTDKIYSANVSSLQT